MTNLNKELENCRKRWVEARDKRDEIMMGLWEKVGKSLKEQLIKKLNADQNFEKAKEIFSQKQLGEK